MRAEGHHAEAVALARGEVADRDRGALGHVGLAAVSGAEAHRGRHVEQQPRRQGALGHVDANVWLARARGDRPVHLAHVVPQLVGPHLCDLGAVPERRGAVLARHEAVDAPADGQVQPAQDRGVGPGGPPGVAGATGG